MEIKVYKNQQPDVNLSIPRKDEFCFYVLEKIIKGECRLTVTDGKRLIICHSSALYPVWVWQPDDATDDELDEAYSLICEYFPVGENYRFNMKYSLASYVSARSKEKGIPMEISLNMLAYSCSDPIMPKRVPKGKTVAAAEGDIDLCSKYMDLFHKEVGIDQTDFAAYRKKAEELILNQRIFFRTDDAGEKVCMAYYNVNGDKGCIGNVYTLPEKRRCGYGAMLVYDLTRTVASSGRTPVLYTDADYAASNACYEAIGYRKEGALCTLERSRK